jgi:hypothetical protein
LEPGGGAEAGLVRRERTGTPAVDRQDDPRSLPDPRRRRDVSTEIRAILLAAALLAGGGAAAAERPERGARPAPAPGAAENTENTASVGAGGLTGSGATRDGGTRRTGAEPDPGRAGSPAAPAAGTAR